MTQYDTVVVGGGPAGYAAAIRCAQLGAKTAIIERHHWGGNSFHHGGVVMATLLRHADVARLLTRDKETFGIRGDVTCDFSVAVSRAHEVSGRMVKGAHFLLRKYKVTEYQGEATCLDAHTLKVEFANAAAESLTCDNLIIATGGLPR
ncbi:MAG: FAD-dependent oxidoreductase, partial [Propionibacteriaceae bacterium]|nr:FAD-dependent oxidoreductase [Propionibacteriaceae bacterium]